jgi:hypothetical protein
VNPRPLRDAELAALLAESPWERQKREAELAEEVERAFERIVVPDPETPVSQVRLRAHVIEERAARARRTK